MTARRRKTTTSSKMPPMTRTAASIDPRAVDDRLQLKTDPSERETDANLTMEYCFTSTLIYPTYDDFDTYMLALEIDISVGS